MNTSRLSAYAPVVVRFAIAAVLLWFGYNQLMHPDMWTRIVPTWASGIFGSALTVVHINAGFEILMGLVLITGIWTRFVGAILALHLLSIASTLGFTAVGVRDFGLTFAALSIFFAGHDIWSFDRFLIKKRSVINGVPNKQ